MKHHELLAPAGSLKIAKAVIDAGADAVYLAGDQFGARAYAGNFSQEELFEILDYAHVRGKKIHLTVNTLVKNLEFMDQLFDFLLPLYRHGLDAVIVQDFGAIQMIRRNFPDLDVHASTQMSIAGVEGAKFLKQLGVSRIVAARELSLQEIKKIRNETGLEIETFIHGALCYSYSGQCLLSSMIGGRSGNRGRCAQPCRLAYVPKRMDSNQPLVSKECYPLSPKDLCAIALIPKLCEAGIDSFKIEGRMKQMEYAAGVTAIYRKYLDLYESDPVCFHVSSEDRALLSDLGNRSGFTEGYFRQQNGRDMLADRSPSHYSGKTDYKWKHEAGVPAVFYFEAHGGEKSILTVVAETLNGDVIGSASCEGPAAEPAQKHPTSEEDLKKQIAKTGGTAFYAKEIYCTMDDSLFLPLREINRMRREVLSELEKEILNQHRRTVAGDHAIFPVEQLQQIQLQHTASENRTSRYRQRAQFCAFSVGIQRSELLECVMHHDFIDRVELDFEQPEPEQLQKAVQFIHQSGKKAAFCFPYVMRRKPPEIPMIFDYYIVRSYDSLGYALQHPDISNDSILMDYNLYVFSTQSAAAFKLRGIRHFTLSPELTLGEWKHQDMDGAEVLVYGKLPLMISAQCLYKNYDRCCREGGKLQDYEIGLIDRYQNILAVHKNCYYCYNILYQNHPLYLADHLEEIVSMQPSACRMIFTDEHPDAVNRILSDYETALQNPDQYEPPGRAYFAKHYSRGHYSRGVE